MIKTKADLKEYINYEKGLYYGNDKGSMLHAFLVGSKYFKIQRYLKTLRTAEYHKNNSGIYHKLMFAIYHRKKHILGSRLGFEIPENVVGKGLMIYHITPVVIHENAVIGENLKVSGMFCVGHKNAGEGAPVIGDNVTAGWGSTIIGDVKVASGTILGTNCTLFSSVEKENARVAGTPARIL